ncbi:MAG TPA: precorrin-3B C(17)-methyltransferase [Polyangiaceae bacterium]|nr:precorrin-3B C(17)-methyltransferase [Polyangiaceae bacterium]
MSGWLRVVGLGPAGADWRTGEVERALAEAEHVVGYHTYLARVPERPGLTRHASDNGDELARARRALELAQRGVRVVVVSGGDAGVFGMAAAVFEALEQGPPSWRDLEITVLPAVTAMLAAAARLGAPLGNDFCAINLSDNLKPWALIEKRLTLAAQADFVIALYNPASQARQEQLVRAFEILRRERTPEAVVMFARGVGRPHEQLRITTLGEAKPAWADMQTLILIGNHSTRCIERGRARPWVYTPRRLDSSS